MEDEEVIEGEVEEAAEQAAAEDEPTEAPEQSVSSEDVDYAKAYLEAFGVDEVPGVEEQAGEAEPPQESSMVEIDGELYDPALLKDLASKAEVWNDLVAEAERELELSRRYNKELEEWASFIQALRPKLSNEQFRQDLDRFLATWPNHQLAFQANPSPRYEPEGFEDWVEEGAPSTGERPPLDSLKQDILAEVRQEIAPLVESQRVFNLARLAEPFVAELEHEFGVRISPEEAANLVTEAVKLGDLDPMNPAADGGNPLRRAFVALNYDKVEGRLKREAALAQQRVINRKAQSNVASEGQGPEKRSPEAMAVEAARQFLMAKEVR